ncbi:MAG: LuxR C-terminal-related transcriptional regulator [Solirubrobacteraceae bacterium]
MAADERARELVERAEQVGGLGSWDWRPQDGDLVWSDNQYRLLGYEPGAVTPSTDLIIEHAHPDDRARLTAAIDSEAVHGLRWRHVRPDGAIRHLEVSIGESVPRSVPGRRLVGSVRDITEQRRDEHEIALHIAVGEALERWPSFAEGATGLLAQMGAAVGALCAQLWIPEAAELACRADWADPQRAPESVAYLTATAGSGPRLAERVWRAGRPVVTRLPRSGGRRTAVLIPVRHGDDVLAVIEIHTDEDVAPRERLLRSLTGVGYEIGHFLHRRRGEISRGPLTDREIEVLQLAADGVPPREIGSRLSISPATVKRHFEGIYARLEVSDRAAAVAEAMRRGLVE